MKGFVVGVDGSDNAAHALRWATREGALRGEPVTAVLGWGLLNQRHPDRKQAFDPAYDADDARNALRAYVSDALGEEAAASVTLEPCNDLPEWALIDASRSASMLVLGGRGLSGFRGMLLGAVSYHCLHHAACPIVIVREAPRAIQAGEAERIVVGVDGSESARNALRWAVDEARVRGASLDVVHCWHASYGGGGAFGAVAIDPALFEEPARHLLERCLDGLDVSGLAQPIHRTLAQDSPAHAVLEAAKGADLVVLGSRGVGGFAGLMLGSTTSQVVHHAECPVVVIPTER